MAYCWTINMVLWIRSVTAADKVYWEVGFQNCILGRVWRSLEGEIICLPCLFSEYPKVTSSMDMCRWDMKRMLTCLSNHEDSELPAPPSPLPSKAVDPRSCSVSFSWPTERTANFSGSPWNSVYDRKASICGVGPSLCARLWVFLTSLLKKRLCF